MKTVDFYFDFMSPFGYLAAHRLPELAKAHHGRARFVCHPIDLVAARFKAGNTGPFNRDQPAKMKALLMDLERWAKRYGIPFAFPKGLDSKRLNKGWLVAEQRGRGAAYLAAAYDAVWGRGGDPADGALHAEVAKACGLSPEELSAAIDSPEISAAYDRENEAAQARGVFGVPIFLVDDQIYWGNDRIEFLEEYLDGSR
jgi:2-hydroxychromene-2-carboxylate isomerase